MSSFVEPSSIVLIIGAICIFLFIMHGLWFSNKPQNRQLKQNNQHDMELSKSNQVGKVRIVTNDNVGNEEPKLNKIQKTRSGVQKQVRIPEALGGDDYNESQASVSLNPKRKRAQLNDAHLAAMVQESAANVNVNAKISRTPAQAAMPSQVKLSRIEPSTENLGISEISITQQHALNPAEQKPWLDNYEIVIVASPDRPYLGEDIETLCNEYGFLPGYVENKLKIYSVFENAQDKKDEVFRICSMEKPFCFPEDMTGFKTSAIALYMPLPPQGKGTAYFRALRMATEIFLNQLGGQMQDSAHQIITPERLDELAAGLEQYDLSGA